MLLLVIGDDVKCGNVQGIEIPYLGAKADGQDDVYGRPDVDTPAKLQRRGVGEPIQISTSIQQLLAGLK